MTPVLTPEMIQLIESLLKHGSRVELLIEQGKMTVVEVKRKMRMKGDNLFKPEVETSGNPMGL